MAEINNDGSVIYHEGEKVKTTTELLDGRVVVGPGLGIEKEVKASDLSPYKPRRRGHSAEDNLITMELAMSNPLKNIPELRSREINIAPISVR